MPGSALDQYHVQPRPGVTASSPHPLDATRDTVPHQRGLSSSPVPTAAASLARSGAASSTKSTTAPLQGEFLERLYERAVKQQRDRREEFDAHMNDALLRAGGKSREHRRFRPLAPMAEKQLYSFPIELKQKNLAEARTRQVEDLLRFGKGKLDLDTQGAMASRLCNESMAQKKAVLIELEKRTRELPTEYIPPPRAVSALGGGHSNKNNTVAPGSKNAASSSSGGGTAAPSHATTTTHKLGKFDEMEKQVYQLVIRRREKVLSKEELQQMGQRLCQDSLRHKGEELEALQHRYQFKHRSPSPKVSMDQQKASADRMWKGEK
jgi:hypothetical protein